MIGMGTESGIAPMGIAPTGVQPRFVRAASTMPTEAADRRLTQRRVIDLKRYAAACCRCC